jgi:D-alanyl-D-alanine carboxypeptidase
MALEKVTGHDLSDLLRAGFVEPLGLRRTTIAPPDRTSPVMRGYTTSATSRTPVDVTDDLLAFGNGGNGGVISNADELLTILQAIVAGRFLSTAMVADMMTAAEGTYGLGLNAYATGCGVFYGHGGAVNGTGSIAMVSAEGRDGVVIAQNLLSGADPDLPALAEQMICTARG